MYDKAGLAPPPLDASDKSWNWERAMANARKMTVYDPSNNSRIKQAGFAFGNYTYSITPPWFRMWNVRQYSEEALRTSIPQEIHLNTPEMKNALTSMWGLYHKDRVASIDMPFNGGKTGSSIEPGWQIKHTLPVKAIKFKIAPLPWAETNSGTLWPDGWRISTMCRNKEAAWELLKFITSPESQRFVVTDPKGAYLGSPPTRKSVFYETLGRDIGNATGMKQDDVFKVHFQADAVGVVKESETICLHVDLGPFLDPVMSKLWSNRISPAQAAAQLQETANRFIPNLFKRWIRNQKFTGKE